MNAIPLPLHKIRPPDHTQLPEKDGKPVNNAQEHPQSRLLTTTARPHLDRQHPDGRYFIGEDVGIYFRHTDPVEQGCRSPDWYYVPGVDPLWNGAVRRSFVLWHEKRGPLLVIEYVSDDGAEERDRTPLTGKFWIYEQVLRVPFYVIYDRVEETIELYHLVAGGYQLVAPNARGHYPIPPMGMELGLWRGRYDAYELPWLRWWDADGNLLPTPEETARAERQRAEQEKQRAEQEKQRAEEEKQRAEQEKQRAEEEKQRAEQEKQRAEEEKQRAEQEKQRAEEEKQRAARLAEKLRELGIDPEQV